MTHLAVSPHGTHDGVELLPAETRKCNAKEIIVYLNILYNKTNAWKKFKLTPNT